MKRLPMPDVPLLPVPVASQKIECTPLVSAVVSKLCTPRAVFTPGNCDTGNSACRSGRAFHKPGAIDPRSVPSTHMWTAPPPGGSARAGDGASTQPVTPKADPLTTAPWAGTSIDPNGATDAALLQVMLLLP